MSGMGLRNMGWSSGWIWGRINLRVYLEPGFSPPCEGGVGGGFMTLIFNQKQFTSLRKKLRNSMTKGEVILWKQLKGNQLGFKFRRQCGVGNYVVDFYCSRLRLVVEIDGLSHASEKVYENDLQRQSYLESLGLLVKRYSSQDVFYNLHTVVEDIFQTCQTLSSQPHLASPS